MIPKIIHYCWFGGNELPELAKKCIKSWKKYCKGYKIIEWNENNFDIASAPLYVRQAYEAKKWAFVTDYVRLYAMTKFGGIYMDTDVEVVASLNQFLKHQAFSGFENDTEIPTGIMACEKKFPLFVDLLKYYDYAEFIKEDGSLDTKTNVEIITDACLEKGLIQNNKFQIIEGFALYPKDYFCPKSINDGIIRVTKNTCTIHHFNSSWLSQEKQKEKLARWESKQKKAKKKARKAKIKGIFIKIFGEKFYNKLRKK